MVLDHCVGHVLHRARRDYRTHVFKPILTLRTPKMKTYHEIDPEEAVTALVSLKNDPNFKAYIKMREANKMQREQTHIRPNSQVSSLGSSR